MPNTSGLLAVDRRTSRDIQRIAERYNGGVARNVFGGFEVATGLRRFIVRSPGFEAPSDYGYAELHADGAVFVASAEWSSNRETAEVDLPQLVDEKLVFDFISLLSLAVEAATSLAGVNGEVAAQATLIGYTHNMPPTFRRGVRMIHYRRGVADDRTRVPLMHPPVSTHTFDISAAAASASERLVVARMFLMDVFQALGIAETEQVSGEGALRRPYFIRDSWDQIGPWAEANRVERVNTTVEEELGG